MSKDVDFVRLNLDPLATTIQTNARAWVKELGKFLNESAREDLNALKGEIEVYYMYTCKLVTCCHRFEWRSGLMVSALSPDRAVWVRALAGDIVLCSWARHFTLTVPLSTQVYKWVPVKLISNAGGNPTMD